MNLTDYLNWLAAHQTQIVSAVSQLSAATQPASASPVTASNAPARLPAIGGVDLSKVQSLWPQISTWLGGLFK
jgi:hypothetical protein